MGTHGWTPPGCNSGSQLIQLAWMTYSVALDFSYRSTNVFGFTAFTASGSISVCWPPRTLSVFRATPQLKLYRSTLFTGCEQVVPHIPNLDSTQVCSQCFIRCHYSSVSNGNTDRLPVCLQASLGCCRFEA